VAQFAGIEQPADSAPGARDREYPGGQAVQRTTTIRPAIAGLLCLAIAYVFVFHVQIHVNGIPVQYVPAGLLLLAGGFAIRKGYWKRAVR
jgi:hypothetical protein